MDIMIVMDFLSFFCHDFLIILYIYNKILRMLMGTRMNINLHDVKLDLLHTKLQILFNISSRGNFLLVN